jgi:hypothetical protein
MPNSRLRETSGRVAAFDKRDHRDRRSGMSGRMDQAEEIRRLSAMLAEMRAELLVTQATLAGVVAELAKGRPEPETALGDAVARMLGFAEAAAVGLTAQRGARAQSATEAALRMADWAEGMLANKA